MRKVGSNRAATWPLVRKAAIELLARKGYRAMNLRDLSSNAGMQAGSLYNYFSSKQELLYRLICETMEEILRDIDTALAPLSDPVEQAERFIEVMVRWHTQRRDECYIGHMELRSLPKEQYHTYVALRSRFEHVFSDIIKAGCKRGVFSVPDERIATIAILQSLISICNWYRPDGRLSVERLIKIYTQMILAQLHVRDKKIARAA